MKQCNKCATHGRVAFLIMGGGVLKYSYIHIITFISSVEQSTQNFYLSKSKK